MTILAIDQGTTSTRALLVEKSGASKIIKTLEHQQYYPKPGWVEHNPEELIHNIQACLDCSEKYISIGIDNQGESCLAWDTETKQAITPVIVWQDNRTHQTIDRLKLENSQDLVIEKTGLPLDSYFSATKLAWIMKNIPEAQKLQKLGKLRLGTTDAFFLDRLANRFVTDISTASRTSLMNIHTGQWDPELCNLFGVPIEALPEIVPTTGDFGSIISKNRQIPVTASIVDQQAALVGQGCQSAGDVKITFGTGAFALVVTGSSPCHAAEKGLLPTVAWQLKNKKVVYALDGGVYNAGSAINWAQSLGLFKTYNQINQFKKPSAIERDLVFVPALSGLGCPYWDRSAGGVWIGLSLDTQPADLMQSILEGIVFRAVEIINAMGEFVSIKNEISIDGGLSANPYFCQFLAEVLNREVMVKSSTELTAIGTAKLAAGDHIEINWESPLTTRYLPNIKRRQYMEKFTDAIRRSTGWRS
ncbi:MAG: glycerol kinase [Deltaproteobacteria bacterium]|jgi:glycerol kinase|nr:glycerol kinase [Deltaproteobacteria bacterium]MBT4527334.1 glycerol kinase [Deltaproteobacteria bacterium]